MKLLGRGIFLLLLGLGINQILIFAVFSVNIVIKVLTSLFLSGFFISYLINPLVRKEVNPRLNALSKSHLIMFSAGLLFLFESLLYFWLLLRNISLNPWLLAGNVVLALIMIYLLAIAGLIRAFVISKQLSLIFRLVLLIGWCFPIVNIIFAFSTSRKVGKELEFERTKFELNQSRKNDRICQTKYPIVMVHGIFFRDWELFNYWGRIPAELEANGAKIFYGGQSSSLPVERSAEELKQRILGLLAETGAEKVNLIAHSKGGIDSRYVISALGLSSKVASLTTINSPHYGSDLAGTMLQMAPKKVVTTIGDSYSRIFKRIGDAEVDFVSSVRELTAERCAELNELLPDAPEVYYQSLGSVLTNWKSAPFPLNVGYSIIKPVAGENDGLVAAKSMIWGNFLGFQRTTGKLGISHGDMIDLSRKNIADFDVMEFYVKLVQHLKEKGF